MIKKGQKIYARKKTSIGTIEFSPGWTLKDVTTRARRLRVVERRVLARGNNGQPIIGIDRRVRYKMEQIKQILLVQQVQLIHYNLLM